MKGLIKSATLASAMLLLSSEAIKFDRHLQGEVPDPGCHTWNYETQSCDQCSWRWVKIDGECVPVSDDCREWNEQAECTSCYWGYHVENGECIKSWSNSSLSFLYSIWLKLKGYWISFQRNFRKFASYIIYREKKKWKNPSGTLN